jgi:hypothetical protein
MRCFSSLAWFLSNGGNSGKRREKISNVPTKQKLNLAKVMASLDTICTTCGHAIAPGDIRRIDTHQIECPKYRELFTPEQPGR